MPRLWRDAARHFAPEQLQNALVAKDAEVRFCAWAASAAGWLTARFARAEERWYDRWVIAGRVREYELGLPSGHPDREFRDWRHGGPHLTWEPCICEPDEED